MREPRRAERVPARVVVLVALVLVAVGSAAAVATAQPADPDPTPESEGRDLGDGRYETSVRYGANRLTLGSADDPCTAEVRDYTGYQSFWRGWTGIPDDAPPLQTEDDPDPDGHFEQPWVVVTCTDAAGFVAFLDGFQLGDPPTPGVLLEHARRSLRVPLPGARFSPDPDVGAPQVVGLQTWVWVDPASAADQTATACIPATGRPFACATITARFIDSGWDMGDGTPELTCGGAGTPYLTAVDYDIQAARPHCHHVYLRAAAGGTSYPVVATTFWHVTWTCLYDAGPTGALTTPCGGGDLGVVGRTTAPAPLEVLDLQARATVPD